LQEAGIKPKTMDFGKDFVNRKVALMLAGSWLPADFPRIEIDTSEQEKENLEKRLGVVPYPVPNNEAETSTLLGGWLLSILQISENKELVWELVTIMLDNVRTKDTCSYAG
jgi:multiple sugar transport system substrate-binding protein